MTKHIFALIAMLAASPALAQDGGCDMPGFAKTMARISAYYQEHPIALFNTQLQVNAVSGRQALVPDGIWGASSAREVCASLQTYAAINGMDPDGFMGAPDSVGQFVTWMGSMARVALNPGQFEAPD